ncbi:hypothetical protein MPER_15831, partial [Moniliophthora perniciosa FA553]
AESQASVVSEADETTNDSKAEAEIIAGEQASDEVAPPAVVEESQQLFTVPVDDAEETEAAKEDSETTKEVQDVTSDTQQEVVVPPIEDVQESIPADEVTPVSEEESSKADAQVPIGEPSTHDAQDEPVRGSTPTPVLTEQI